MYADLEESFGTFKVCYVIPCLYEIQQLLNIDDLLERLKLPGIGCRDSTCEGAFGYTNDVSLLDSNLRSIIKYSMIKLREDYIEECPILFNLARSRLLCYNLLSDSI